MAALGAIGRSRKPIYKRKIFDLWQSDPGSATPRRYSHKSWLRPQAVFPLAGDFLNAIKVPNNGIIGGITQENGVIISRCVVRLYHRKSGYLAGETISDDSGNFIFRGLDHTNPEQWLIVALDPSGGESYNALVLDKITPYFDSSTIPSRNVAGAGFNANETGTGHRIVNQFWRTRILALSPVVYYPMDETSGTVLIDASANGLHGTIGSAVLKNQPGLRVEGTSMYFNGNNSNAVCQVPYNDLLAVYGDTQWSASCIVKPMAGSKGSVWNFIFGIMLNDGAGTARLGFVVRYGVFQIRLDTSVDFNSGIPAANSETYRCFFVRDNSTLSLYINGVLAASTTTSAPTTVTPGLPFQIGGNAQYPTSYSFNGYISDVALFNYALTPEQIANVDVAG